MKRTEILVIIFLCLLISPVFAALPSATNTTIIGFSWNQSSSSPTLAWIDSVGNSYTPAAGFFDNHKIWGNMWRCTIDTSTNALTFGSNARGDGLDLTGAAGPVMVVIPKFYVKYDFSNATGYNIYRYWVSATPQAGYTIHPNFVQRGGTERDYVLLGAYAGSFKVDSTTGTLYLDSVTGRQPWAGGAGTSDGIFRLGFDTGTGSAPTIGQIVTGDSSGQQGIVEGVYTSGGTWGIDATGTIYLSRPWNVVRAAVFTNEENVSVGGVVFAKAESSIANANYAVALTNLQDFADNHGSGWGIENIWHWSAIQLLFYTEYGSLNSQNALGKGITDKAPGTGFAGNNTGIDSTDSNIWINGTGTGTGTNGLTPIVYRGIENPWSNIWNYLIGFNSLDASYHIAKRDGTGTLAETLAAGQYETSACTPLSLGISPFYVGGYITNIESETLLQLVFVPSNRSGGGSTTYLSDYAFSHYFGGGTRILFAGGYWAYGANAGVASRDSNYGVGHSYRDIGARPEFLGATNTSGMTDANFTSNATSGMAPLPIQFTDTTTGVAGYSWNWSFGDGSYSTNQNPVHTYTVGGEKNVSIIVTNVYGGTDTETKMDYINVTWGANFTATPLSGCTPLDVQFTDFSNGGIVNWSWTFGDGGTSFDQNPLYTYNYAGVYDVNLTVTNSLGSTSYLNRIAYVNATFIGDFSGSPISGSNPLTVNFIDASCPSAISWWWSFGDGGNAIEQNPSHTFTTTGVYIVSHTATNIYEESFEVVKVDYISVSAPGAPTANFHGTPTSGPASLTVTFFDDSTGSPTSWNWSFGDGAYSTNQNPSHTYTTVGLYTVGLNATNAFGSDVFLINDYINVTTVTPTPTPTQTPSNATTGGRIYSMEETFVPFWLWAVIIILGSSLLLLGLFGQHLIFGILSAMCFSASAFTSPLVGFFYQETVLADATTQSYYVFPLVWLVIQGWMAWLLWGMVLISILLMAYGVLSGFAAIKKPGDEFLEDDWLDHRDF